MKQLPLKNGQVAIVDDEDYERLSKRSWTVNNYGYAISSAYADLHVFKVYWMHREIIGCRDGYDVDHINGNKLDNRKCNLRECTRSQNNANRKLFRTNTTGYKGVYRSGNRFRAIITQDSRKVHLGMFPTPEEAALVYNMAAIATYGEFARVNLLT